MGWRNERAIQHAVPVVAGEGFQPAGLAEPADRRGGSHLVVVCQQAQRYQHTISVRRRRKLYHEGLCRSHRTAHSRQQAERFASRNCCPVPSLFRRPVPPFTWQATDFPMISMFRRMALALAPLLLPPAAWAHAFLAGAAPPVGSQLPAAPAALTLRLTEPVEPLFC